MRIFIVASFAGVVLFSIAAGLADLDQPDRPFDRRRRALPKAATAVAM
jgi:Na+-transporting NADH:ubiquinone oxidoreductase subunit NqrC